MTSKIKVDNINKVSDDTNIIKKCGTTTTIGSGASNPIVVDGSTVTLGRCGGTVALASGATQTGFGRTGTVDWQTTPKTATFTAANGEGYFIDTSSGVLTANLPAGSAGAIVSFADYTRTFATNNFTIAANGSEKIGGVADDVVLNTNGQALTLIYVDATEGWINVQNATETEQGSAFISATGGTITTVCTNFKVHTFTGPGTFCVSAGGGGKAQVDYLVIAGGGGGGSCMGGGGGAGGYRESHSVPISGCYTAAPTASATSLQMSPGPFAVSVGGGGAGGPSSPPGAKGTSGVNSTFSTITSAGGGGGGSAGPNSPPAPGGVSNASSGGSGGGQRAGFSTGSGPEPGGAGNTPPVTPPQGQPGGKGFDGQVSTTNGGGGGGSGAAGDDAVSPKGGNGGAGLTTSINGSAVQRAAGGGGGSDSNSDGSGGAGGGGGAGAPTGTAGTVNTGSGAGGGSAPGNAGGAGGSGIVIIRYKFQ